MHDLHSSSADVVWEPPLVLVGHPGCSQSSAGPALDKNVAGALQLRSSPGPETVPHSPLRDQTQERELPHSPPLSPPNLLQTNGIVAMIVDVVDPMLGP